MKKILSTIALVFAVSALTGLAQDATSSATPPAKPERHWKEGGRPGPGGGPMREAMESLTPAEREQFMEARKKAEADPIVIAAKEKAEAARKEAMEAQKAAMLKADPAIVPILEKIEAAMKAKAPHPGEHGKNAPQE